MIDPSAASAPPAAPAAPVSDPQTDLGGQGRKIRPEAAGGRTDVRELAERLDALTARMAAPLPTPEELTAGDAEDRALATRIHAARPGVPTHHAFAVLQTLRMIKQVEAAAEPEKPGPEPRRGETEAIGVGMPATLHLNAFGREIDEAFGHLPFLVGSAMRGKTWRDVDVRLILPDDEFDALFPDHMKPSRCDGKWALLCAAISELGRIRTGLPIDFQIQRMTEANALYDGPRSALGLHPKWAA